MNEKGCMDYVDFLKYFKNSFSPLYPNIKYEDGKHVMLKVDSGPGRLNSNLLAYANNLVFIIYLRAPNTTAETE